MSAARWRQFFTIMAAHGVYEESLDWRRAFTTRFLDTAP